MNTGDSMAGKPENDREQRRRAVEDTKRSLIVEASAGTGKTSTLIGRILHLVLDQGPEGVPLPVSRICAITFTEKAAGELKVRLRQHFEQIASAGGKPDMRQELARNALSDLETAAISTIHSFAVSLLKERPVEAGLDPRFSALDAIQSEIYFREVWESWIADALLKRHPVLEKGLRGGFSLERLENLARILRLNWLAVRDLGRDSPPGEAQYLAEFQKHLIRGNDLMGRSLAAGDKLAVSLGKALDWLAHPDRNGPTPAKPGNTGAAGNWTEGKSTVLAVREFLREVIDCRTCYMNLPAQQLLDDVVRWIMEDFVRKEWENRKIADGKLDFDDQLWRARELLKNPAVRRDFQKQYQTLLVDEFQDTDPVQWEIVLLLSSTDIEEKDPGRLRPDPGRLFIVGDPKQSIYRFRNADIETYLEIAREDRRESLGIDLLRLTTNFRSVPSILGFVDAAFGTLMRPEGDEGRFQQQYLPFGNHGHRATEPHPPSVCLLADRGEESDSKRTVREFIECESRRIAKLIREICGSENWKIQDPAAGEGERRRAPQYGDIAVLLPVLTHTDVLEEELHNLEIPYVLEGGKFYYTRSEVSSAVTLLRAIANPNDQVALYGSLRSIFFGLSDEDLLRAHIEGLPLDYRGQVPLESPLCSPFEILRDLHRHRHERRASETFETLLQRTGAREVLAARGFQSLANLNKLGRTLRALQGEATFAQVVDLLGMMEEEGIAESESRLMEERSNAVRILSIHKAKGLDFPIVFVAALGLKKLTRGKSVLADPHGRKIFALSIGPKDAGYQTPTWKELHEEEKRKENAELVRLLYVGLTRARDYMILSVHTAGLRRLDESGRWIPDVEGTRLAPLGSFLEDCFSNDRGLVRRIDKASLDVAEIPRGRILKPVRPDWGKAAEREYRALRALRENTLSSTRLQAAHAADTSDPEGMGQGERLPDAVENRSVRLGIAFHEAMEHVDLFCADGSARCPQELSVRHRLDRGSVQQLEAMMRISLSSGLLERARAAVRAGGRMLRELPFVRPLSRTTMEEGKIDLLFDEGGGWVLVDYKTDRVSKEKTEAEQYFRQKYSGQILEYLDALKALSVEKVSAYLLLARTGDAVKMN